MKRFLSLVMAFLCCIACIPSAMAYNAPIQSGTVDMDSMQLNEAIPVYSFETNEYDMYTNLQSLSESTLLASGYSEDEVAAIKNTTIEDLLYQRAQLSSDDLQMMGYSEDEISLLKNYNRESLTENPELKRLVADFSGELALVRANSNTIGAAFEWYWSKTPLTTGLAPNDMVACGFAGTRGDNLATRVKIDTSKSSCRVYYHKGDHEVGDLVGYKDYDLAIRDVYHDVNVKFPLLNNISGQGCWAAHGKMTIVVKEEATSNTLYSAAFAFGYGHTTLTYSPSISVSVSGISPSLSFGLGTEETLYKTIVINNEGQYDIYNGEMN